MFARASRVLPRSYCSGGEIEQRCGRLPGAFCRAIRAASRAIAGTAPRRRRDRPCPAPSWQRSRARWRFPGACRRAAPVHRQRFPIELLGLVTSPLARHKSTPMSLSTSARSGCGSLPRSCALHGHRALHQRDRGVGIAALERWPAPDPLACARPSGCVGRHRAPFAAVQGLAQILLGIRIAPLLVRATCRARRVNSRVPPGSAGPSAATSRSGSLRGRPSRRRRTRPAASSDPPDGSRNRTGPKGSIPCRRRRVATAPIEQRPRLSIEPKPHVNSTQRIHQRGLDRRLRRRAR